MNNKPVLLYVDAGMRPFDESRTRQLCRTYADTFVKEHPGYTVRHLKLAEENLQPNMDKDIIYRDGLVREGNLSHPVFDYANEFASADYILIGAPYWDLSFPAILKIYLEKVCVADIAFKYTENGARCLCKARRLTYITTCGGFIGEHDYGTDYMRGLCRMLLGIPEVDMASAEGLDIVGADIDAIMAEAHEKVKALASKDLAT